MGYRKEPGCVCDNRRPARLIPRLVRLPGLARPGTSRPGTAWQDGKARAAHDEGDQQVPDNLTPGEARARATVVTVSSYQVELDLTGGDTTFPSVTAARLQAHGGGR